ncbi:putative disease resistance RPP13-like protein 1 [Nicotiana tomentosiformis]|uniref:putative disease resistance RPP13-like protein 1 n=1 Tax=Nicotiana tomentosiformis TaxID=4098 RepID=UPI00051B2E0C|nr:putative disease resistance RPP13-like protein 1 [Nicotiana tomentosiformis]XP_018624793.1 putative disease resistance RPP13-like protein 1 [Nicotiana tomentosiformis]XP_018624794.1 putative disease resistance RPP13-like protein 1 [Nicotiana tomentosiformis]
MDIGLAVGGAFLSSALKVLFDRLAPQGELLKMFQRGKHDVGLLKRLKMILLGLQAVLSDAENKQTSNPYVREWLNELRDAVDSAENLIEEINYEVVRVKVEGQNQNLAETSNQQVSDLNLCLSGRLGLKDYLVSGKQETRGPSTSLVDESDIFGRQNEIEILVDRLLSVDADRKTYSVIPIVGMAGVGKTTLAKAVYNNEKVKDHFDLKAWFCVSEPYDASRITKGLLQEIDSSNLMVDNNLNQLQIKLKESLKGKKFLIVLDDVWNDKYIEWDNLRNPFAQREIGSKIIVTTRKESVAEMMGSRPIIMEILSSEFSWPLFKRHAFENRDPKEHLELEEVGKQIAKKCKGLPLALKTLAGLLRSKSEVEEWRRILRSEIWELPDNGILPALMLSYNDLPVHLKQCFSYCAIFPKDYPFDKEQVIQLWIANGLVQRLQKDKIIEDSGNQYFLELRSRSLFERVPRSSQGNTEKFLMHDLVNDLAQVASSKLCINLEDNKGSDMLGRCRHLSYSMLSDDFEKLKPLDKLDQLRTFLPIPYYFQIYISKRVLHNILPRLTSLRALSLSCYAIKELPNNLFIKLKFLRFLDLSLTDIKQLPDSICVLYNLETLLLSSCRSLVELPMQMQKLINLRHLDISDTPCLKKPQHLSKLKSIRAILGVKFFLGGSSGSRMEDLGELNNLYGSLSILELQNVADRSEALEAKMRGKEHIEKLSFEWSVSIADNSQNERDILGELHPNPSIKELEINGYRGTNFPNWLADYSFSELVELSLSNCKNCYSLPALGQLPSLKFLIIRGMRRITEVTEEFYGSSSSKKPFNSLERLEFAEMLEWKQWHVLGNGEFPILQNLSIKNCPKLIGRFPENLCSLTILTISNCPELNLETPIQLSSLKKFEVEGSPKAGVLFDHAELFLSQFQGMKQILELYITNCHSLTSLPISSLPSTFKEINIYHCEKLKLAPSVGDMISIGCNMFVEKLKLEECGSIDEISPELVPQARYLSVKTCHSLTKLLIPNGTEDLIIYNCENIEILSVTSLRTLDISHCKKLKSLPEHMQELLPSLKKLELENCPEIESFPEGGLPFNLEVLKIWNCNKLVNGRKEWRLQRLSCLRDLIIYHDGSDEEIPAGENWELPCFIRRLTIYNLKTFSSQDLKSLTSLESLCIQNLPQIQALLEEGLPSSLSELTFRRLTSLRSLQISSCESALPCSLSKLHIWNCHNLQSLPESALPSSLSVLEIENCPNLQSLSEPALPSSLSKLVIWDCPKLQFLPVKRMPSSISELYISGCPLLKPLLEFDKGNYWTNIAHIPTIYIDCEYL